MLLELRVGVEEAFVAQFALVRRILQELLTIPSQFHLPLLEVLCVVDMRGERREGKRREKDEGR